MSSFQQQFPHLQCSNYIEEYNIGFRMVSPHQGQTYEGKKHAYHSIVFMLDGSTKFSYNQYLNRIFKKGDLFFTPQASDMYGYTLEDSHMLVLTFDAPVDFLCENCSLSNFAKKTGFIDYDFCPLKMTPAIWDFAKLMEQYLGMEIRCSTLHRSKQIELFILLQYCYTKQELLTLFYPALGMVDFKAWVLENYNPSLSMGELATMYHMTPKSFSRKFNKEFGATFQHWRLKQKSKHIKLKLSMPGTTFIDMVDEFDFSDLPHFYRFCKEQYGCTARELLHRLRGESAVL